MQRLNLDSLFHPYLLTLPERKVPDVAFSFAKADDVHSLAWITAAGYLPESPDHHFQGDNAKTPWYRAAAPHLKAFYTHSPGRLTTAYAPHGTTEEPPPFQPPEGFTKNAFTACFRIAGEPYHLGLELRHLAGQLSPEASCEIYLAQEEGAPERLPRSAFIDPHSPSSQENTPYGVVTVQVVPFSDECLRFNAAGIRTSMDLPFLEIAGGNPRRPPEYVKAHVEAAFGTPLADYFWKEYGQDEGRKDEFARGLRTPVLKAMAIYIRDHADVFLLHPGWNALNQAAPDTVPLPEPFYLPWKPPKEASHGARWQDPQLLNSREAYRVDLESAADHHLLALAWKDSKPGVPLVHPHPHMTGYPWIQELPRIDRLAFSLADDPGTVRSTHDDNPDDRTVFSSHSGITLHLHVSGPRGASTTLDLPARCAFSGRLSSYPTWDVFLATEGKPDPEELTQALLASYFKPFDDLDVPSQDTQHQEYHLETLRAVHQELSGYQVAQQHLMQELFNYYVFPHLDDRPILLAVSRPHVTVHFPPEPDRS